MGMEAANRSYHGPAAAAVVEAALPMEMELVVRLSREVAITAGAELRRSEQCLPALALAAANRAPQAEVAGREVGTETAEASGEWPGRSALLRTRLEN